MVYFWIIVVGTISGGGSGNASTWRISASVNWRPSSRCWHHTCKYFYFIQDKREEEDEQDRVPSRKEEEEESVKEWKWKRRRETEELTHKSSALDQERGEDSEEKAVKNGQIYQQEEEEKCWDADPAFRIQRSWLEQKIHYSHQKLQV